MEQIAQSLVGPLCGVCACLFLYWGLCHLWRRAGCNDKSVCSENVERIDGGADCKHKVFLCHSGEEKDFVEHMCCEIKRHDRSAFLDKNRDSLRLGCDFPREIFKAIEECEAGVVVLSKAFFTKTRWPMKEFARLAKRKEENKEFVLIMVLYDIELAECKDKKKQTEWEKLWTKWARSDKRIVIEDWTSVFKLFGPAMSISRNKEGDGRRVIGEVVAEVCKRVMPETRGDDLDMQGRERICELVWRKMQAAEAFRVDGPRVVGLYGMGGIGKSTVCKAACEKLRSKFGGRVCHVELPSNSDEGKEKELLGEMVKRLIGTAHEVVVGYSKTERLNLLKEKLQSRKVFVAIDNVGEGASSRELARDLLRARFTKDSFVVMTARSIEMLQELGISERECHEMPELDYEEAESLFLINAPKGVHPKDDFTKECVDMCYFSKGKGKECHYHPLALKVLRGQLGWNLVELMPWLRKGDRFNALGEREHPINRILRSSFDSMELENQYLFMDVALFFPERRGRLFGLGRDVNIMAWLSVIYGWTDDNLKFRLKMLKRKSLIECIGDGKDVVGMHDLWREFCVTEARKDERWFYRKNEILESCKESEFYGGGWKDLQRVCLICPNSQWPYEKTLAVRTVRLQFCSKLTVLKLVNVNLENRVVNVSPLLQLKSLEVEWRNMNEVEGAVDIQGLRNLMDLRVLIVVGIPSGSACIGEIASLVRLQVLVLREEDFDEWKIEAHDPCTVERGMTRLPDLGNLCHLRFVSLELGSLPSQQVWTSMKSLQYLYLGGNKRMLSCNGLEDLAALVELDLEECYDLKVLPCLGKLRKLEKLNISRSRVSAVPGLDCLVALQEFRADMCYELKRLPDLQRLSNLEVLVLEDCEMVEPIRGLEKLTSLRVLRVHFDMVKDSPKQCPLTNVQDVDIESWGEQGLPCMVGWTGLKRLNISGCRGVHKLEGLESLSSLQYLRIFGCDFGDVAVVSCLASLQELCILDCKKLERVPSLVQLLKLETLFLRGLGVATWEVCGSHPQIRNLSISESSIVPLPDLGHLPELRRLYLSGCDSLTRLTSEGPLAMLEYVSIASCCKLEFVPNFSGCTLLREVCIQDCKSLIPVPVSSGLEQREDVHHGRNHGIRKGKYKCIKGALVLSDN